jgi:ParB-like chromosome segregation protein Spo0J
MIGSIDREGNVVAGHGRLWACRELGWTEVPTLCLDHPSAEQARAYMIADNKLTENADWNDRLLAQQLKDLSLLGLDFSLEITGFEMGEIDLRIAPLAAKVTTGRAMGVRTRGTLSDILSESSDRLSRRDRFAHDSPLEETGFEPLVPLLRRALVGVVIRRTKRRPVRPQAPASHTRTSG